MNWRRTVRYAVRSGLRNARLRSLFETELKASRAKGSDDDVERGREDIGPRRAFIDRHGTHHPLDPTLRDRLKPGWRTMLDPVAASKPPTDDALRLRARGAAKTVAEACALIEASAGDRLGGRVLEVGCYDGAVAFQLSRLIDADMVASDLARYYVASRPEAVDDAAIDDQVASLAELRERARKAADAAPGAVRFVEDDITHSTQPSVSFDAIVSFEVLEHVRRPDLAFAEMARLLRPGGIAYNLYNPFLSINGGHSLCTLAFPWGHARLDVDDLRRYLEELRPTEVDQASRFYRESLNGMTLAELRRIVPEVGLELVAVFPWFDRKQTQELEPRYLAEVERVHPTATVDDLLATFVTVIARRPRS